MAQFEGTNFGTSVVGGYIYYLTDKNNLPLVFEGTVVPTTGSFAIGALFIKSNGGSGAPAHYVNIGTTATPNFVAASSMDIPLTSTTIATTSNTDAYVIAPEAGVLTGIDFSGLAALATSDTNYITWTVTNLAQDGTGTNVMLAATPAGINTTKATGGTAVAANTKYPLTLSGTAANLVVAKGDRLLVRAAATGTLANTVTFPAYMLRFTRTA